MQAITAGASFVADPHLPPCSMLKPLDHLAHNVGSIGKNAQLPNLTRTNSIGHGDGDRRLVHIESNVGDRTHLARLQGLSLCAGLPPHPSNLVMSRDGPPLS